MSSLYLCLALGRLLTAVAEAGDEHDHEGRDREGEEAGGRAGVQSGAPRLGGEDHANNSREDPKGQELHRAGDGFRDEVAEVDALGLIRDIREVHFGPDHDGANGHDGDQGAGDSAAAGLLHRTSPFCLFGVFSQVANTKHD